MAQRYLRMNKKRRWRGKACVCVCVCTCACMCVHVHACVYVCMCESADPMVMLLVFKVDYRNVYNNVTRTNLWTSVVYNRLRRQFCVMLLMFMSSQARSTNNSRKHPRIGQGIGWSWNEGATVHPTAGPTWPWLSPCPDSSGSPPERHKRPLPVKAHSLSTPPPNLGHLVSDYII